MVEELYTTFRKDLLRYCTAMTQAGAEDLVQETFLRAMAHLDELEDMGRSRQRSRRRGTSISIRCESSPGRCWEGRSP